MDFYSDADVVYYFQITGYSGRIYLDGFSFGDGFELRIDGHARSLLNPVKLYPETGASFNPLHKILDEYHRNKDTPPRYDAVKRYYHDISILPECSIGGTFKRDQKAEEKTVYRFRKCKVLELPQLKHANRRKYVIGFRESSRS